MELAGSRALVTGGAVRLGRAMAVGLAKAGCDVAVHCFRSADSGEQVVAEIRELGRRGLAIQGDLRDPAACEQVMAAAVAGLGGVELLINSAAVFRPGGLATTTLEDWDDQLALDLRAPFLLSRAFVAALGESQGRIVNVVDARLRRPSPGHLAYRVAKAGLAHLTELLAVELAPRVTVNGIAPGAMLPPPGDDAAALRERVARTVPLGVPGGVRPVVDALLYLLRADFVTGVILPVDGGEYL
jgi:pteridine reductase